MTRSDPTHHDHRQLPIPTFSTPPLPFSSSTSPPTQQKQQPKLLNLSQLPTSSIPSKTNNWIPHKDISIQSISQRQSQIISLHPPSTTPTSLTNPKYISNPLKPDTQYPSPYIKGYNGLEPWSIRGLFHIQNPNGFKEYRIQNVAIVLTIGIRGRQAMEYNRIKGGGISSPAGAFTNSFNGVVVMGSPSTGKDSIMVKLSQ
ncbi:hypothetical protein HDU76_008804, partial [Blyttiomyces sp. JEL0837]